MSSLWNPGPFIPSRTTILRVASFVLFFPLFQTTLTASPADRTRTNGENSAHYYLAAEPVLWNFLSDGKDSALNHPIPPALLLHRASWKIRFIQYSDPYFTLRVSPEERLGIIGPALRATAGQSLVVTFLNRSWLPLSMEIVEGAPGPTEKREGQSQSGRQATVNPGDKITYRWPLDGGRGSGQSSLKACLYRCDTTDKSLEMGLLGLIIATEPAHTGRDGMPNDIDREMVGAFLSSDENQQ